MRPSLRSVVLAAWLCSSACAPHRFGAYRGPTFAEPTAPGPTAVVELVQCNAPGRNTRGNTFVPVRDAYGEALKEKLQRAEVGIDDKARGKLCSALTATIQGEWGFIAPKWWDVEPPVAKVISQVTERTQAKTILVPMVVGYIGCVNNEHEVRNADGVPVGTVVDKNAVTCTESSVAFVGAFLFSADGTMLWKAMQQSDAYEAEVVTAKLAAEALAVLSPNG